MIRFKRTDFEFIQKMVHASVFSRRGEKVHVTPLCYNAIFPMGICLLVRDILSVVWLILAMASQQEFHLENIFFPYVESFL